MGNSSNNINKRFKFLFHAKPHLGSISFTFNNGNNQVAFRSKSQMWQGLVNSPNVDSTNA
jgi:hypothetical protein